MRKEEIRTKGLVLAVPDEFLKSCKVGNVLFRVWFQVGELYMQGLFYVWSESYCLMLLKFECQ